MAKYINEDMLLNHIQWLIAREDDKIHFDTARRIIEDIEQMCCVCKSPVVINVKGLTDNEDFKPL